MIVSYYYFVKSLTFLLFSKVVTVCGEADGPPEDELVFGDGENDSTPVIIGI